MPDAMDGIVSARLTAAGEAAEAGQERPSMFTVARPMTSMFVGPQAATGVEKTGTP